MLSRRSCAMQRDKQRQVIRAYQHAHGPFTAEEMAIQENIVMRERYTGFPHDFFLDDGLLEYMKTEIIPNDEQLRAYIMHALYDGRDDTGVKGILYQRACAV